MPLQMLKCELCKKELGLIGWSSEPWERDAAYAITEELTEEEKIKYPNSSRRIKRIVYLCKNCRKDRPEKWLKLHEEEPK